MCWNEEISEEGNSHFKKMAADAYGVVFTDECKKETCLKGYLKLIWGHSERKIN